MKVRVLSLWQPWATLWMADLKRGETRHFRNPFVGFTVIHATKYVDHDSCANPIFRKALQSIGINSSRDLPTGAALGTCIVEPCRRVEEIRTSASREELEFGNFTDGRYWWPASHKEPFAHPIPLRGQQSVPWMWEVLIEHEGIFDKVITQTTKNLFDEVNA